MSEPPEETPSKGLFLFGRDVSKMPCFRNSYLYGIGGGLASGLAYFMFTSRTNAACNFGVASFAVVTLGYWTRCRYEYSKIKFEMLQMQEMMKHQTMFEGTQIEQELDNNVNIREV